jgi:hypothetical protein
VFSALVGHFCLSCSTLALNTRRGIGLDDRRSRWMRRAGAGRAGHRLGHAAWRAARRGEASGGLSHDQLGSESPDAAQLCDGRSRLLAAPHCQRDGQLFATAGSWYAWPSTHVGYELVAAGMLIMAGGHDGKPFDYDALERWTRVGYERGMRSRKGER